ncbi:glycosyltransferase family 2 protein [Actinoplanes sp. G11-F43]|uniref:glycosyltransferase family 2 protein n=1 Tax=Actinoplanes sp. G11-F43 TaxID=3424130 RepID=UPI003D33B6C6
MTTPVLSVCVPAYGNGHLLTRTLDALTRQSLPTAAYEVIVVDDGSEPSLEPIVTAYLNELPLTLIRQDNRGRSAARNRAMAAARGRVFVFLDADQAADPGLLQAHHDFHATRGFGPGVLLGRAITADWAVIGAFTHGQTPTPAMADASRGDVRDYLLRLPHFRAGLGRAPWICAHTNNASIDRATAEAVGGFDEALTTWGGEDNEFFYRVFRHHDRDPKLFDVGDDAISYDLPHFRLWPLLMAQLADNFRQIFHKHPRYDVELFTLPGLWTTTLRRITWFEDALTAARTHRLGRADLLPGTLTDRLRGTGALVIGFGADRLDLGPDAAVFDHDTPAGGRNRHLAGLAVPEPDGRYAGVVAVDLWRFLPPEDLAVLVLESLRIGGRIDLVATGTPVTAADLLPLPFADDLDYLRDTVAGHLPVRVSDHDGARVLTIGGE